MKRLAAHITLVIFSLTFMCDANTLIAQKPIDSLLTNLEKVCEKKDIPGVMISIVNKDSTLYAGGVGFANIEKNETVTAQHLFRLGSISKSFAALGFVKLADQNKVDFTAPIKAIDPNLSFKNKFLECPPGKAALISAPSATVKTARCSAT